MRTLTLFLVAVVALLASTSVYLFFSHSFSQFGPEGVRLGKILDAYPKLPQDSILFIGESQIREDIDCKIIEQINKSNNCFNLGLAGITPVQLALQTELIISARPKLVVLGITSSSFDETFNQNNDLFFVMNDRKVVYLDSFMEEKLNDKEKKVLTMGFYKKELYKRKFIFPFYLAIIKQLILREESSPVDLSNFKNPHFFTINQTKEELETKLNDPQIASIFKIENSAKRQREAFLYLIKNIKDSGIPVVVMQMPVNSLVFDKIPKESKLMFNNYLEESARKFGFVLINLEDEFESEYFTDLTHLNLQGARIISQKIAEGDYNIIQ